MITYKLKIDVQGERERYEDIVFTTGDKRGYRLEFAFYSYGARLDVSGCALTVKTRRLDGAVVIDSGYVDGQTAYYDVADNAYEIPGEVKLETALIGADGSLVTVSVITAQVREGFGEAGLSSEENEPVLAKLEAAALTTQGAVNEVRSELDAHQTDAEAHAEAFALERTRFNPLYANALKGNASGNNITVTDSVEGTPVELTLYGATTEVLADKTQPKSPDNPATITGIGESGSVTVTVYDKEVLLNANSLFEKLEEHAAGKGYSGSVLNNIPYDGRNCIKITSETAVNDAALFRNGAEGVQYTLILSQYVDAAEQAIRYEAIYSDGSYTRLAPTKTGEWEEIALTTEAGKTVERIIVARTSAVDKTMYIDSESVSLNEGAQKYQKKEAVIPLDEPLYGLKSPTTGTWLTRDTIRVSKGRVVITRYVQHRALTSAIRSYVLSLNGNTFFTYLNPKVSGGAPPPNVIRLHLPYSDRWRNVLSPQLKSTTTGYGVNDLLMGGTAEYEGSIRFNMSSVNYGADANDSNDVRTQKLDAWLDEYNASHSTPITFFYAANVPVETDITDTEAGQALLALAAQNGTTYLNSEGADMEVRYNRDVNKAIEELQNAVAALNAAAVENI